MLTTLASRGIMFIVFTLMVKLLTAFGDHPVSWPMAGFIGALLSMGCVVILTELD